MRHKIILVPQPHNTVTIITQNFKIFFIFIFIIKQIHCYIDPA